jgi:hypothetical protein
MHLLKINYVRRVRSSSAISPRERFFFCAFPVPAVPVCPARLALTPPTLDARR